MCKKEEISAGNWLIDLCEGKKSAKMSATDYSICDIICNVIWQFFVKIGYICRFRKNYETKYSLGKYIYIYIYIQIYIQLMIKFCVVIQKKRLTTLIFTDSYSYVCISFKQAVTGCRMYESNNWRSERFN